MSNGQGYPRYLPLILLLGVDLCPTLDLKRKLENSGCQVYWANLNSNVSAIVHRKYFDLIVSDMEQSSLAGSEMYHKLKTDPELVDIPVIVLMPRDCPGDAINGSKMDRVYYLAKDAGFETRLLQIIRQIHYMTYRYL